LTEFSVYRLLVLILRAMNYKIAVICAALLMSHSVEAQLFKKKKKAPEVPAIASPKKENKMEKISDKTKSCIKLPGLFTVYRDTNSGQMYFQVSSKQLDVEYIHFTYTENGVMDVGAHRGAYRGSTIFKIRKVYDNLEFAQQNTSYYFDPKNAISKSANANISEGIMAFEKIIAKDENGNYLISADELFLTEQLQAIKEGGREGTKGFQLGKLAKGKTQYEKIKNYPENLDVIVRYVFDNPAANGGHSAAVTDSRYVSVVVQHSFIAVPNNGFKPRRDDYRIGYFSESVNDMTGKDFVNFRDLIHRWDLQKKDPNAALSEPVKPIVWWIENTTPKELRPVIKEAALQWNKAFEPLGFINAIQIFEQPDTATWDAGDIRYNVLRWTSSPNPPFGGYGPSFVNPRTGEILGADIMFEFLFLTNRVKAESVYPTSEKWGYNECEAGVHMHDEHLAAQATIAALELDSNESAMQYIQSDTIILTRLIKESIHYLVLHEMGHTLGLMHNMRASQLHSPDELVNSELTYKTGLIGSVMDYPAINLPPQKGVKVQYCQTEPGPYDRWAIEYGYSVGLEDASQESVRLRNIARKSVLKENAFGNDADDVRAPGKAIDPRVMVNDLSNDAMGYSESKLKQIKTLLPELQKNWGAVLGGGAQNHQAMVSVFNLFISSYATHLGIVSRYVGGVFVERFEPGQITDKKPYTAVTRADQLRALKILNDYIFAPSSLEIPSDLASYLQPVRRGFGFFSQSEEPKMHGRIESIQESVLDHLLHPNVLRRMTDNFYFGNSLTALEYMNSLTDAIFKQDLNGLPSTHRRQLQIMYVERLMGLMKWMGGSGLDPISKTAIHKQLIQINNWMSSNNVKLENTVQLEQLKAHRDYLHLLLEQFLDD
jgi:hypothetical protein